MRIKIRDNRRRPLALMPILLIIGALFLAACQAVTGAEPEPTDTPDVSDPLPAAAVLEAQAWLADRLGVSTADVTLVDSEQREWTDSCLGLGGIAEICAAVITPGWLATFEVDGVQYEVRTDETGQTIRGEDFPPEVETLPEG